jgi:hypothetical protein
MASQSTPRHRQRKPVKLPAKCRTQGGLRDTGRISDISAKGCCITTNGLFVRVGLKVVIRPEGLEGLMGEVRWIEGERAGIEFEHPLYEPVVDHLARIHAAGEDVSIDTL